MFSSESNILVEILGGLFIRMNNVSSCHGTC